MNTTRHEQIEADLKAFLDGELPFFRRAVVARHIQNCPQCQQEIEFMQTIEKELETATSEPLATDLRAQILESVPSPGRTAQSAQTSEKLLGVSIWKVGLGLAGIALACMVLFPTFGGRARENARRNTPNRLIQNAERERWESSPPSSPSLPSGDTFGKAGDAESKTANRVDDNFDSRGAIPQQRAVHREGNLSVVVDNAEAASSAVEIIVKNTSGFIANNSLSTGSDGKRAATMDLRIPVAEFGNVVNKISKLGTVSAKSVSGEDITARVAKAGAAKSTLSNELAVREAQLKQKEKRERKGDASTLYMMRAEVRTLRVQASQARAQLETLQKFAALSNLYVTLHDKEKPVAPVGWTTDINQTGHSAWNSFQNAAKLPIQLIIWILAYSPLWLPALIIWKKFGKKWLAS